MKSYTHIYPIIEAIQVTDKNKYSIAEWCGGRIGKFIECVIYDPKQKGQLLIKNKTGCNFNVCNEIICYNDSWIVKEGDSFTHFTNTDFHKFFKSLE